MSIFGITLAKNEADIIDQMIREALTWCSRIAVIDNGSTDGTQNIVEQLATEYPDRVVFWGETTEPFDDSLRRYGFNLLREHASLGDWWCRLDADEFYPVDPRGFLDSIRAVDYVVWSIHLQYYYTDVDYEKWKKGEETVEDRNLPIQERRRYYRANASEGRFFRHRPGLTWNENEAWPAHLGPVAQRRIPVQHFQYRDPIQIQKRLAVRRQAFEEGYHTWATENPNAWKEKIVDASTCHYDEHNGEYHVEEDDLPEHIPSFSRRLTQYILHSTGIWS